MTGKMIVLHPNGERDEYEVKTVPSLGRLQTLAGGYIQIVPRFNTFEGQPCVAICNDEGKINGLPENHYATSYWTKSGGDTLVGPVIILTGRDIIEKL